jgi:hypothetical protein
MINLTGAVGAGGKYLVTGMPVDTKAHTVLKIVFENKTAGTNLGLFAGTGELQLSDSGGPGYQFLTIIDTHKISGKIIHVLREVGTADSVFSLTRRVPELGCTSLQPSAQSLVKMATPMMGETMILRTKLGAKGGTRTPMGFPARS